MLKKLLGLILAITLMATAGCTGSQGQSGAAAPADSAGESTPADSEGPSGSQSETGEAAAPAGGDVSLWLGSWWEEQVPVLIDAYKEARPDVNLAIEALPINGYLDKAVTTVLSGDGPDILAVDVNFMGTLYDNNLIEPWDDRIEDLDLSDFSGVLNGAMYGGKYYGMPYRSSSSIMYYNKTMFDEAGVDYPAEGWTNQDMLEMARQLTIPGQQWGLGIAGSQSDPSNVFQTLNPILWAFGGDWLNEDETECTITDPKSIEGITFWTELYTVEKVVPDGVINYTMTKDIMPLFIDNKVAMMMGGDQNFIEFQNYPNLDFDFVVPPEGPGGTGGWVFTIPVTAKNADEGFAYCLWFLEPENLGNLTVRIPSRLSATQYGQWNDPLYQTIVKASMDGRLGPQSPQWPEMQKIIITELQNILQGAKSVEQACEDMNRQCNELL